MYKESFRIYWTTPERLSWLHWFTMLILEN